VPETLVLLHGFSGTRRAWDRVIDRLGPERYLPLALDLPGHGAAVGCEGPITFVSCVASVLAQSPERFALCGYSLGGRIALHVALHVPERVTRLILISSTAGIEDPAERSARRVADRELAARLEREPVEDFIERWRGQPLFAGEPPDVGRLAREDQRRNEPRALAAAMRGIGTGEMAPLWGRLGELSMPVTIIVGERDAKFRALGERMLEQVPKGGLMVIPGGHGLPLENPGDVARVLAAA
jgi:2-succinyl-6-hydroxy-2,4-cyclohexadiene-1-carboxylate synthase